MSTLRDWLLLILALPTENATARMRFWRALKAMGCAVLRDGVYLLPAGDGRDPEFRELADAIIKAGGTATVIHTTSHDRAQDERFRNLFDRCEAYDEFARALASARKTLSGLAEAEVNRLLRRLRREYAALRNTDYFPGEAAVRVESAWTDFVGVVATVLSPGEPQAEDGSIARLHLKDYQSRTWATRRDLWVDRVASAWLIRRHIDPQAQFLWLENPAVCPQHALGFDFDGAAFTHAGDRVTFEALLASFGLDQDHGLVRMGALVHALDVGGLAVPEASGFEALMTAARQRAAGDDDALLDDMGRVLDSFYSFYSGPPREKR